MDTEGLWEGSPIVEGTTLLKPVPYEGIDKDEKDEIIAYFARERSKDPDWSTSREDVETVIPYFKLVGINGGKSNIKVGPVIQVNSVAVFNNDRDWVGAEIFGDISISGGSDIPIICIYKKDPEDPESVSPGYNMLSLSEYPIAPGRKGRVAFNLFSENGDRIFSSSRLVDYEFDINDDCTRVRETTLTLTGEFGYYAQMNYSIIPFAYVGIINMCLVGTSALVEEVVIVEGDITVNGFNLMKGNEFKFLKSTGNETVYSGEQVKVALALPVTSPLMVDVSVSRDGIEFASEVAKINPTALKHAMWYFKCTDKKHYFRMLVDWIHPESFFDLPKEIKSFASDDNDIYGEVFSVFIGGGGSNPSPICGSIVVRDRDETVYIFSRNEQCPDNLSWDRRCVSLVWPDERWVLEKNFCMHFKLKDVFGNSLCRGSFGWWNGDPMRFDRRMCAVIPGKDGYFAAVHYSIFANCLRAKVTMTVDIEHPCDFYDVYVSIFAEYSNYDYSSSYDKEHYRVIVFKRPEEERAKVQNYCGVPLSKSLITAPSDCSRLIVRVNMLVRPFNASRLMASTDLSASRKLQFVAGKDSSKQLSLREYVGGARRGSVTVKVDWFGSSHGSRVN